MLKALFLLLYISPGIVFAQGYGYYPGARAPATIPLDEYHGPPPSMMNSYAPKGPLPLANNFGPFAPRQHFVPQPRPFWRPPPPPRPPPPNFNYQPYSPPPPPPPRQDYDVPPPAPSPPPPPPTRPPPPPTTTQSYDEPAPPPSRPYVPPLTWRTPAPQPPPPSSYEPYESEENEYNYGPAQTTTRAVYRPSPSPPPPSTRKPTTTTQAPSSYEPYESEENEYNYPETTTTRPAYRPSPSPPPSTTRKPTTTQAQSYEHYEPYEPYESEEYETTTRKPTTKYRPPPTTTRSPPPTTRTTTTQPPPPPPETYEPYEPYESEEYEPTTKPAYRPPPSTPAYESEENEYNYGPVETTTEQPITNNYDFAYVNTHEQTTPPTTTTRMAKTTTTTTRPTTTRAPYRAPSTTRAPYRAPSTTRAPYRAPSTTQRRTYPTTRRTNPPTTARRTTHRPPSTPPTPRTRGPEWVTPPMSPKIAYFPHSAEEGESPCDAAADEGDGCWDFFQYVPGVKMGSKTPQKYEEVESEERSEENPYQPEQTQKGYRAGKEKYSEEVPETYMVPPKEPDSSEFTQPPPLPVNEKEKPKEEIKATEYKRATDKPDVESTTYKFPTGNEVFVGELEEPVVDKVIEVNLPKDENPEKDIDSDEEIASTRKPMKPSKGSQLKWIPGDKEHEQEEKKIVNESGEKNGKVMEMSTEKTPNTSEKQKEMVEVSTEKKEEEKEEEEEKREIPKPKELKEEETPTKVLTKVLTPKSLEREDSEENEKPQSTEKTLKSREWKNEEITAKPIIVTSTTTSTTITTESITITTENVPEIIKTQPTSPPSVTTKSPIDSPPITTNQSFQSVTHDPRFLNNTRALIEERVIDINHLLDLPPRPSTTTTTTTVTTPPSTTMINESDPEPLNRQEFSKSNPKSNQSKSIKPKPNQSKEELNRENPKEFPSLSLFRQLSYNGNITIWREFVDGKTLNNTTVADEDQITVEKPPDRNVFLIRERQNELPNRFKIPKMNAKNEEEQKRELWPDFEKTTVPNEIRSPQKIPLSTVSQGEPSIVRSSTVANENQSQEDQTAISINQQLARSSTIIQTLHQATTVIPTKSKSQMQSNLIQSNQIPSNPIHSNPIQSNPIHSNPIQSNPIHSNPIHSNPIQSNPIQSTNPKDPQFFTSTTVLPFDEIFEGTTPGNTGRKRKILDSKRLTNQKIWNWTNLEPEPKIFEQKLIDNDEKKKHKENDNQTSKERRISANSTANFPKEIPTSSMTKEATTMGTNEVNGSDLCSPNDLKCLLESIPSGKISQQVVVNERTEGTTRTPNTTIHTTTTTTITTPTSATLTTTTLSPTSSLLPSFPSTTNPPTTFLHSFTVATPLSSTVETSEFSRLLTEFPIHSLTNDDKQQQQQHFVPHIDFRQIWHDRTESTTVKLQFPESSTIQSTILSDERVQNLVERGVPNHVSDRLNHVDVWKSMKIKEEFGKDPIEVNEISIALMNTQKSVSPTTDPRALTDLLPNFTWFSTRSPPLPPLDASTESPNEMNELNELDEMNERNELINQVTPPIISLSTPTPDSSLPEIVENHLVNEHSLDPDYDEFPKPQVPSISFPLEELPLTLEEKEVNDDQPNETTEGPKERSIESLFKPDVFVKKDVQGSKINFYNEVDDLPPNSHHRGISVQYLEADRPDEADFPEPSQILQPASPKPLLTKVFLPGPGPVKGSRKCCSCCGRAGTPPRAPESHRFDESKNKILVTPSNASPNEGPLIQQEAQPTPPPQYPQPSQFPLFSPQQPQYQPVYPQSSGCPCQSPPQSSCCQPAQPCCLPQLSLPLPRPCCIPQPQLCCQPPPPPPIACCPPPPPCCSQPVIPPCQRACPSCPCRRRMALAIRRLKRQSLFGSCQQCSLSGEPYRASEIQGGCTNCAARLTGFRSKRSPADDVLKFLGFQVSAPSCAACSGSAMRMARRRKRQTGCESGCTRRKRETETLQREKRSNPIGCSPCNNLGQLFARSKRETENRVKRSSSPFGCSCNASVSTNYGQSLFGRYKRQVETVAGCDATCCDFSSCPNEASFERSRHRFFRSIL